MNPYPDPGFPILHLPGVGAVAGSLMTLPLLLPVLLAALSVAALAARRVGRALGARPILAFAMVASVGVILAATLTPLGRADNPGFEHQAYCSFTRMTIASWNDIRWESDVRENIVLFIPLGLTIALLPRSHGKLGVLLAAVALPFVIEATQLLVAPLGRGCESSDVIDNLTGLAIGLAAGAVLGLVATTLAGSSRRISPSPEDGGAGGDV